jgi:hypothetical protein
MKPIPEWSAKLELGGRLELDSMLNPIPEWSAKLELGGRLALGGRLELASRFQFGVSDGDTDGLCGTVDCRPPPKKFGLGA